MEGFGSNRTKLAVVTTDRLACLSEQANDSYTSDRWQPR